MSCQLSIAASPRLSLKRNANTRSAGLGAVSKGLSEHKKASAPLSLTFANQMVVTLSARLTGRAGSRSVDY